MFPWQPKNDVHILSRNILAFLQVLLLLTVINLLIIAVRVDGHNPRQTENVVVYEAMKLISKQLVGKKLLLSKLVVIATGLA